MALPAVLLAASGIASLAQTISGLSRRSRAKRLLEDFERQELKNVADQLKVSTLGAELQSQEAQRRFATSVDALRSAGVRGVVGGLPAVEAQQQRLQRQIAADLDRQQKQIDLIRAQDEARIRQIQEQRESMEIAGLGSEMAAGSREFQTGLSGLGQTATAFLSLDEGGGSNLGGSNSGEGLTGTSYGSYLNQGGTLSRRDFGGLGGGTDVGRALRFINPFGGQNLFLGGLSNTKQ